MPPGVANCTEQSRSSTHRSYWQCENNLNCAKQTRVANVSHLTHTGVARAQLASPKRDCTEAGCRLIASQALAHVGAFILHQRWQSLRSYMNCVDSVSAMHPNTAFGTHWGRYD